MANQVDFKILPSDQFSVHSPATRSEKIITYFTLLSKLRGDILAVSSQDDPNNIVSAYYTNVGNTQTLHLVKADGSEVTASNSFAGTVTSVDMSVPIGFAISGNPITTSGTLNVSFASGYSLPTNALQATWTTAYNRSITSAAVTGTSTKTLTLNQQDGGTITASWSDIDTGLTSVGLSMPSAFAVANSPLTVNGTIAVTGAGTSAQYIRGDGQLANFPSSGGGGSTINYYLNGSVNQGTFGGTTYYEMSKTPIAGAGTNFTRTAAQGPGYIASFITDPGDPALLNIPGGNWNIEIYFSSSSSGGGPSFYGELYKVSSSNVFTLIASNSASPEGITNGTILDQYFTSIAVPQTTILATDRLAIRIFVNPDGRNITLHTEDNNFCEVITTFSTGLNALNGLTAQVQYFATGTSGTDFNIDSVTDTHTFNLPTASATNRGALSSADWTTFNSKASDAFKTIAVAGQSNVVANSATDTLTLEAGSNIVITTDAATDKITITAIGGGSGSVTSVDMSVPTGFSISGNPITTTGTLALAFASGYSLPTNASQATWDTAYNNSITAFAYNNSTGVLTLTQQDAGTLTATVTLQPFTTDNLTQGSTNLYDKVVSLTGAGTTVVTGTYPNFTITSNDQHVGTVTSIATSAPITGGTITTSGTIGITQSGTAADGYLSSTDWNTFNSKVGGSGTINYVSKWTSTGAIGNSQIFDSGTYVGINTATPAAKLDISGAHVASIGLLRLNASAANIAAQTYYIDSVYKGAVYASTDDNFYILGRDADIVFSTTSSATARMTITNGGNVGIGTSSPTQKLMVSGSVRVTGGYYDSSNSIGSNGQVLASTGSGTTWINASGGTVNGSGTVNYLSKWTGTTLLADSQLFDDGTNVGVGTATPNRKLTVSGNGTLLGLQSNTAGGYSEMEFTANSVSAAYIFKLSAGNSSYAGAGSFNIYNSGAIGFHTASVSNAMFIASSTGNIGLGNTGPTQKLHVEGNIRVTGAYYDSANGAGSSGQVLSSTGSGTSWITPFSGSGTTNYVAKWTSGTAIGDSSIYDNGNVGIGTTAPNTKLRIQESGTNPPLAIQNTNVDGYTGAWLYNSAGTLVGHFGWGNGTTTALSDKMYFGTIAAKDIVFTTSDTEKVRITSAGNVGIGTTSPSRLLHVAGNAQVDGWIFQGGYYTGSVTLPYPGANYGNGRIYLRLCSSASGRIMTAKVRISSTWNWAPAFGSVEADISFYWTGSSLAYSYVNILSATGQAATNLTFGALEVEGGSISVPVYSTNSNPIYAYIQLSPDADPSQVSYSTWGSVAFPGQSNVYVQTSLGVGTPSPSALLHVNGTFRSNAFFTLSNGVSYWGPNGTEYGYLTWDTGYARVGASGSNTLYLGGSNQITILNGGNVGIGETSPSQKLHITGNVRVTGAYYDSSNAAGTSGQILSSTGTGTAWISPGGGGGIITGSGTTNYVTKWTGTSAVGDSSIYDNGNVGIGNTAPNQKLELSVGNGTTGGLRINYAASATGEGMDITYLNNGATTTSFDSRYNSDSAVMQFRMKTAGTAVNAMTILGSGNVGIGTTAPGQKLQVDGSLLVNTGTSVAAYRDIMMGGIGGWSGGESHGIDTVYGTAASPTTFSRIESYFDGTSGKIRFRNLFYASSPRTDILMTIQGDGNVGIGTDSPSNALTINRDTSAGTVSAIPGIAFKNRNSTNSIFVHSGIFADTYRDVADPHYSGGVWFTRNPEVSNLSSSSDIVFGTGFNIGTGLLPLERMRIISTGNVGINETAPSQKLHVSGNIRVTGAYYDSANGAGTSGQILSSTGTGTAWIAAPSGGITGSGTTNYVTKWTSGSAVGNSVMYDNGTNVIIGSTVANPVGSASPSALTLRKFSSGNASTVISSSYYLGVGGNEYTVNSYRLIGFGYAEVNTTSTYPSYIGYQEKSTSGYTYGDLIFGTRSTTGAGDDPVERMRITAGGNVGIGTTAPGALLQVGQGSTDTDALIRLSVSYTGTTPRGGIVWHDTANVTGKIHTDYNGSTMTSMVFGSLYNSGYNSNPLMVIRGDGNVGIGNTSPNGALSFADDVRTRKIVLWDGAANNDYQFYGFGVESSTMIQSIYGSGDRFLWTVGTGTTTRNELMVLKSDGNLGIGTTSPLYKLQASSAASFGTTAYGVLNIAGDNPAYIKIRTAIPFSYGSQGYTVNVKGFQYGGSETLDLQICWHQYADIFYNPTVTSKGSFAPVVRLARESGLVVIVLTWGQYWPKLYVESVHNYVNDGYANGWSWVDENVTGDKTVTLSYKNNFGDGFVKTAAGNVGIGTTSPSAKLHIQGAATDNVGLALFENTWSGGGIYYPSATFINTRGDHSYGVVAGFKTGSVGGTSDRPSILFYSDSASHSWAVGQVTSGWGSADSFGIGYRASNDPNSFGGWPTNYFTILTGGNVGIGTTAPGYRLHVKDSANVGTIAIGNDSYPGLLYSNAGSGEFRVDNRASAGAGYITFYPNGQAGTIGSEAMRITTAGNVGIGTTSPYGRLELNGSGQSWTTAPAIRMWDSFNSKGWLVGNVNNITPGDFYIRTLPSVDGNPGSGQQEFTIKHATGNVGIGTTAPGYKLDVSGTIRATGDVIAYSDARVKENVETLDGALDKVMKMRGVSYNKIGEQEKKVGVIAQEILEVLPEVVSQDETGTYSVAYGNISAVLIEAIKELTNTVKEQQKQIDELKSKLK